MAYINIDVDLDEFETEELVDEVLRRFRSYGRKQLTDKQKAELKSEVEGIWKMFHFQTSDVRGATLEDQMKRDVIMDYWNKYSSWQFEEKLKP